MPTPQKLAISISDSQLDLETEIDPDWERLIGSPRFEAARQRCGLLLSDLQTERAARPGADEVQQAVAARKERRRKLEVRAVLQARQADAEKPESPTLGVGSAEWVAMMRKKNEEEVEVLRQKVRTANEVQKRRTTQEIVSRIADAARADQMKEAQAVREAAAAAREEARQKEVKKKQEALARQRVQMEAERAAAVERQEELLVRRLFAQRQQEEAWRQQHEEKLVARKKAAEEREKVRLAELEEHRKRVEAKAEEERKALIAQQQKKEERVNLWAAKEKEKQDKFLKETKSAELLVGQRLTAAGAKVKVMEAEKRQAAEARQVAADARTERIEADKKTAIVARRQLQAARFSRQEKLYREIRTREETEKLIVEERLLREKSQIEALKQRQDVFVRNRVRLGKARDEEKQHCVERARRAKEHVLNEQRLKISLLEERATSLQKERRLLAKERLASARKLSMQRAMVQEKLKAASGSLDVLSKSTELLASLGLSPESLSELANEQIALQSSASAPSFPGGSARRPQSSSSASVTRSTTDLGKPARPQTSSGEKPPVA